MLPDAAVRGRKTCVTFVLAMAPAVWTLAALQTAMALPALAAMALLRVAKSRTLAGFAVGQD